MSAVARRDCGHEDGDVLSGKRGTGLHCSPTASTGCLDILHLIVPVSASMYDTDSAAVAKPEHAAGISWPLTLVGSPR